MNERCIYALGFFDGVHLGHQALLRACQTLAKQNNCKAGAMTFSVHPDALVSGKAPLLINSIVDRGLLLQNYGMESVVALTFDKSLMTTHWSKFLTALVEQGAAGFVCGSDFRFGAGGLGTAKKLEAFCKRRDLPCAIVPQQELDGIRVSSTYIRSLLEAGDVESAKRFLGHPHILCGEVIRGKQLGRTMGIPTANLALRSELVQLPFGVYACYVQADGKRYPAVTNIGTRPTVEGKNITIEPWILDFDGDLYGKHIVVEFHKFLRPEQKFSSLTELKEQIEKDAEQARSIL